MPGFDGTGPEGRGPLTGRGFGYCVMPTKDYNNIPRGYGYGRGRGRGRRARGHGRGYRWQHGWRGRNRTLNEY